MGTSSDGDRPWQSYNMVYTNAKAGMDGVDKEKIQRIVYEMSKGSKYFENEQRKEAFCKQKIENLRAQVASLTDKDISHFQKIADRMVFELEASRDLSKVWLHTDMDAFYAAVETLENPSLRGKPMAVGNLSMISTANYEARKFGVRAAMPGFIACKLCPDLIFVPTNFERYTFYSGLTRKVFRRYDPEFIATSLDEAYLNITDVCISRGVSSDDIASELRDAIFLETGLTCSVGVAPNHMLAKVCSDINKPNGQFILPNDKKTIMAFVSSLPIRKIGGIGKVTEHVLRDSLEINTCEDMIHKGAFVCALFSSCSSDFFLSVGLGLGRTNTPEHRMRKSISSERTFRATKDESFLFKKLGDISETLSIEMLKEGLSGRTLTLKLKTDSFEIRTRAVSLRKFIHTKDDIFSCASNILKAELPLSLRLIGLRLSQFHDEKNVNVDPMQKTIVGFLTSDCANPSATLLKKQDCSDNDMLGNHGLDLVLGQSIQDAELDFLAADDYSCERQDDRLSFLSDSHSSVSSSVAERFELNDFCLVKPKPNNSLRPNGAQSFEVSTPLKEVSLVWIDDYICSICGTELPSSFKEERLEHSDYHIAEILQEEESSHGRNHRALQERRTPKELHDRENMRKKKKMKKCCQSKPLKHVPIEDFFSKLKKNS